MVLIVLLRQGKVVDTGIGDRRVVRVGSADMTMVVGKVALATVVIIGEEVGTVVVGVARGVVHVEVKVGIVVNVVFVIHVTGHCLVVCIAIDALKRPAIHVKLAVHGIHDALSTLSVGYAREEK